MSQLCYPSVSPTSAIFTVDENLLLLDFVSLGGSAVEENVSSEVTEEHKLRRGDVTGDAVDEKADEPQPGLHDVESMSSGSSIELLDISDEVQNHTAAESPSVSDDLVAENSVEVPSDGDRQGEREMRGSRDAEEFTNASQSVMLSSTDHFNSAVRSESSTCDSGEVENVLAVLEADSDTASDAVGVMPSEAAEQSVDDNSDEDDSKDQVTEADRAEECQQTQHEVAMQQNTSMSPSTDGTVELESYTDNTVNGAARFDVFSYSVKLTVINNSSR